MKKLGAQMKRITKTKSLVLMLLVALFMVTMLPLSASAFNVDNAVEVTGYRISHGSDSEYKGPITTNMSLTVELTIHDRRFEAADTVTMEQLLPGARMNTGSFRVTDNTRIEIFDIQQPSATTGCIYRIIFYNIEYTGTGNTFQCDLLYNDIPTLPVHTVTLPLNQCVEYVPPSSSSSSSSSSTVVKGTGFVLKSASYGDINVQAGQRFTLTAVLLATNGEDAVENVTVGVTPPKEISLADGTSLVYVGTVKPGQSIPASFELIPGANTEDGSYTVVVDIKGINARTGEAVSASVNFSIPVVQPERFEIFSTQLPSTLVMNTTDGMGFGTVTLVNQGKGTVSNVSVDIVGNGITSEDGKQYIGHVAGGEQKSADFNLMASEPGQIDCQVVVTYESTRGEKKTLTYDFSILVEDVGGGEMMPGEYESFPIEPMPGPGGGFPWWGWALIGVAVVGGTVLAIVLVKKRKAKKAAKELEYLGDDDEDI